MDNLKTSYDNEFKTRVALEAIRNERTLSEIAFLYGVDPGLVARWKKQLLKNVSVAFECGFKHRKNKGVLIN